MPIGARLIPRGPPQSEERLVAELRPIGRGCRNRFDRIDFGSSRTPGVGYDPIFGSAMVETDGLSPLTEQIYDGCAPQNKIVGRDRALELGVGPIEIDKDLKGVPAGDQRLTG